MNSTFKKAPIAENSLVLRLDMVLKPPAILAWIGRRLKNEPIMWLGGLTQKRPVYDQQKWRNPLGRRTMPYTRTNGILPVVILHVFFYRTRGKQLHPCVQPTLRIFLNSSAYGLLKNDLPSDSSQLFSALHTARGVSQGSFSVLRSNHIFARF